MEKNDLSILNYQQERQLNNHDFIIFHSSIYLFVEIKKFNIGYFI